MALNLDLKKDNGMDLSLPSSNNTSKSGTPQETNCERLQALATDIKKFAIIIENFQVDDQRSTVKWSNGRKRPHPDRATTSVLAPNFLFPIPNQILSTANREETHSTATPNRIAPSYHNPVPHRTCGCLCHPSLHHVDSTESSSITILTAPHPSTN
ncbi:hypothetical protein TNIN_93631 [Trichonephila inaurata madagascariensis]|uniref:Uncharacterized protein n=1 Tax=Trichonephila inaurata madagascariensis TaxID=2747483 RepID=A0A8X7BTT3_9ARAC|nr:hypothetical protein TNIN_93631 [Trichonephila inaurata madagascariensis]